MIDWTRHIDTAIGILANHGTVRAALPEIGTAIGYDVSEDAIRHAFKCRGLGSAAEWVKGGRMCGRDRNARVVDPAADPVSRTPAADEPEILSALVDATRKRALPLLDVCDRLDASPGDVREAITWAQANGYHVRLEAGHVFTRLGVGATGTIEIGSTTPGRKRVAVVTDIHFGSRYCNDDGLRRFLGYAVELGCEAVVCTGDVLDGHSPKLTFEQRNVGLDDQIGEALSAFRGLPIPVLGITGNHDGYFSSLTGQDTGRLLEDRMRAEGVAWTHLGSCLGEATIHGAQWQLWHPHGGAGTRNAVRRVLNDRAEAEARNGRGLDVLALGHFHKHVSFTAFPERTFCVAGGCWQTKGSEFSNRITREWDVGGTVVSYDVRQDGSVGEFAAEFYAEAA